MQSVNINEFSSGMRCSPDAINKVAQFRNKKILANVNGVNYIAKKNVTGKSLNHNDYALKYSH